MKIVFMGTPDFSVAALEALIAAGHEICAVYTQPPRRAGRGKAPRPSAVAIAAEKAGLPVRHPVNFRAPQDVEAFAALDADVAVVVAYGLILPQALLDAPRLGCLNIHASLLPRWRGAAPIQRAIMAGDSETGVCIMQMEAGLDTGPVFDEARIPIGDAETASSLHDRLAALGAERVVEVLHDLPQRTPRPQSEDGVTYAQKIAKDEARIDWSRSAQEVGRLIRGLSPFPGAWSEIQGQRIKFLNCKVAHGAGSAGTILRAPLTIACGTDAVEITQAQRPGKGPMVIDELLRGFSLPVGETFI